jgi:hypothetical protein
MNVISCSTQRKQKNREEYFIKKEEAKQELQRVIMNERIKHIKKKKYEGIKGRKHSDEESDLRMSNDSFEHRQHVIEGISGIVQPSHQNNP